MHGTKADPKRHHPVVDLNFWQAQLAPKDGEPLKDMWIDSPGRLVHMEMRRAAAFAKLGKVVAGIPIDLFLWGYAYGSPEKPYLTRVGGIPWREAKKKWPVDRNGKPLVFIAQICFVDSRDIITEKLPGDVLLIFSGYSDDYLVWEGKPEVVLEWSSIDLKSPAEREHVPHNARLPFSLEGAIHRTMQYPDHASIFGERSLHDAVWQGTIIGRDAFRPQGDDSDSLIATFSSIHPSEVWPLLNVPALPTYIAPKGHSLAIEQWRLGIGDAGIVAIQKEGAGRFVGEIEF